MSSLTTPVLQTLIRQLSTSVFICAVVLVSGDLPAMFSGNIALYSDTGIVW